ncbi:hypothetical protein [Limisalsivibrio acetivorans]|uniref:hypothetical protein n=1 Tax=Limisalsivibrio acetivorans TaxID=1304888 RepID=UPI0003B78480|nr:hypothetical protein [Limisalsivibrio acetivorans]
MKSLKYLVIMFIFLVSTLSYSADYSNAYPALWEDFLKENPLFEKQAADYNTASKMKELLELDKESEALNLFGEYTGGVLMQRLEDKGIFRRDRLISSYMEFREASALITGDYYKPDTVNGIYPRYRTLRSRGASHKTAWNAVSYSYNMLYTLPRILDEVIYPLHGITPDEDDFSNATKIILDEWPKKKIWIRAHSPDKWSYDTRRFIIHDGGDDLDEGYESVLNIELTYLPAFNEYFDELITSIYDLNNEYTGKPGHLTLSELKKLEGRLRMLLLKLDKKDVMFEMGKEAQRYAENMLKARYASQVLLKATDEIYALTSSDMDRINKDFDEYRRSLSDKPEDVSLYASDLTLQLRRELKSSFSEYLMAKREAEAAYTEKEKLPAEIEERLTAAHMEYTRILAELKDHFQAQSPALNTMLTSFERYQDTEPKRALDMLSATGMEEVKLYPGSMENESVDIGTIEGIPFKLVFSEGAIRLNGETPAGEYLSLPMAKDMIAMENSAVTEQNRGMIIKRPEGVYHIYETMRTPFQVPSLKIFAVSRIGGDTNKYAAIGTFEAVPEESPEKIVYSEFRLKNGNTEIDGAAHMRGINLK